ncbi:hypothetical protein BGZ51_000436 [Haplosporangium sp. Z 767]|nr:hypothetical protein BGZ51_000436 [Haplosporangium sp. Z 767]
MDLNTFYRSAKVWDLIEGLAHLVGLKMKNQAIGLKMAMRSSQPGFHPEETSKVVKSGFIVEYRDQIGRDDAHNALRTLEAEYSIRNYYGVFNMAAISVNSKHSGKNITSMPGFKIVWPAATKSIPELHSRTFTDAVNITDPYSFPLHTMTCVDAVHQKFKFTGKGIKIGIIDGVSPTSTRLSQLRA